MSTTQVHTGDCEFTKRSGPCTCGLSVESVRGSSGQYGQILRHKDSAIKVETPIEPALALEAAKRIEPEEPSEGRTLGDIQADNDRALMKIRESAHLLVAPTKRAALAERTALDLFETPKWKRGDNEPKATRTASARERKR